MPGKESEAAWSPDGRWIAFVAKRSDDKESQLYLLPTDGGEAIESRRHPDRRLRAEVVSGLETHRLHIARLARPAGLAEGGRALKEREDSKMKAKAWSRPPIAYWDHWIDDRQAHVFSIPLEGGTPTAITHGTGFELTRQELDDSAYAISPDGNEIAFVADIDPTGVDQNFDVFVVPATGGQARNLTTDNSGDDENPQYSPDGRWLLFTRQTIKGFLRRCVPGLADRSQDRCAPPARGGLGPLPERTWSGRRTRRASTPPSTMPARIASIASTSRTAAMRR